MSLRLKLLQYSHENHISTVDIYINTKLNYDDPYNYTVCLVYRILNCQELSNTIKIYQMQKIIGWEKILKYRFIY